MYYLFATRDAVVGLLPEGLRLCEVGVQQGIFSHTLLALNPALLYLVDPWEHQADAAYQGDAANVADAVHLQHLDRVTRTFGQDPRVKILRGYSEAMLGALPAGSLDAVYVDGNHTYQAVLADLVAASRAVHDDGLIMGHDFCSHWRSRQGNFGVIGAVLEFCKATGADLFGLTCSAGATDHSASFSTFFISKKPSGALKRALIRRVFDSKLGLVDLPLSIVGAYSHTVVPCADGSNRYIPSFSV